MCCTWSARARDSSWADRPPDGHRQRTSGRGTRACSAGRRTEARDRTGKAGPDAGIRAGVSGLSITRRIPPCVKPWPGKCGAPLNNLLQSSNIDPSNVRPQIRRTMANQQQDGSLLEAVERQGQAAAAVQGVAAERRLHADGLCRRRAADCFRDEPGKGHAGDAAGASRGHGGVRHVYARSGHRRRSTRWSTLARRHQHPLQCTMEET